jgi:hypothetical protein
MTGDGPDKTDYQGKACREAAFFAVPGVTNRNIKMDKTPVLL